MLMIKKVYNGSPIFIKKQVNFLLGMIPYEKKLGRDFINTYSFLEESQWWSRPKLEEYQMEQIKKLLEHAYKNVPYYTSLFNEYGINVKSIQNFNDMRRIPYLTKDIVRNNLDQLIDKNINKNKIVKVVTGGTTGIPMDFYEARRVSQEREWAFISNLWSSRGYDIHKTNKFVYLRGNIPLCGYYEKRGLELILSSFQLTSKNMENYLDLIAKFKPDYIQAYPSSIFILAKYIQDNGIKFQIPSLKAIFCSSENLFSFQRRIIEEAFSTKVYSHYGHSEKACLAGECEKSTLYHLKSEYGYTEIINNLDIDVTEEDEIGEIVCTGFNNYIVPFIRYKTNDIAVNTNQTCNCGRDYKLLKRIEGRKQDFFVDRSGSLISMIKSHSAVRYLKEKITAYQFVQNVPGEIILNLEANTDLNELDYRIILKEFLEFYPGFRLKIEVIDKIPRSNAGKYRYLVQNIKNEFMKVNG